MKGIEKEMDRLGRIVIPMDYRKQLGLKQGSRVSIALNENGLIIEACDRICALCGKTVEKDAHIRLCGNCIRAVRAQK